MRRRKLLRRIGAGTAATAGLAGVTAGETPSVRWTFGDGHTEVLRLAAFERHPETPSVAALRTDAALSPECCCCKTVPENCASCSPCPCDDGDTRLASSTLTLALVEE